MPYDRLTDDFRLRYPGMMAEIAAGTVAAPADAFVP